MKKQTTRILALALVLFGVTIGSSAQVRPERSSHCPPDPDAGWIICGATCEYPNVCRALNNPADGVYCWQAALVNGYPANVCHSGDYDPCCDPNYQW